MRDGETTRRTRLVVASYNRCGGVGQTRAGHLAPGRWAQPFRQPVVRCRCNGGIYTSGSERFRQHGVAGLSDGKRTGRPPVFSPEVAIHLVKVACERLDDVGRSLSHWDCAELARQLIADEVVDSVSPQTVQRILANHKLAVQALVARPRCPAMPSFASG
ncbi:MAG: helix-turn-helix domain-containing protein [Gemmataceae bacterium]